MAERTKHQGDTEQDPPWPSLHPEDDYDGARVVEQDDPDDPGIPTAEDGEDDEERDLRGPADETD